MTRLVLAAFSCLLFSCVPVPDFDALESKVASELEETRGHLKAQFISTACAGYVDERCHELMSARCLQIGAFQKAQLLSSDEGQVDYVAWNCIFDEEAAAAAAAEVKREQIEAQAEEAQRLEEDRARRWTARQLEVTKCAETRLVSSDAANRCASVCGKSKCELRLGICLESTAGIDAIADDCRTVAQGCRSVATACENDCVSKERAPLKAACEQEMGEFK